MILQRLVFHIPVAKSANPNRANVNHANVNHANINHANINREKIISYTIDMFEAMFPKTQFMFRPINL